MGSPLLPLFNTIETLPNVISAEGAFYQTTTGPLLDAEAGYWCTNLGHGFPPVADAATGHCFSDLSFLTHDHATTLAKRLTDLFGYKRAIFLCSGSSAMDCAMRIAFQVTSTNRALRSGLLSVKGAYHGSTGLTLFAAGGGYSTWLPFKIDLAQFGSEVFLNATGPSMRRIDERLSAIDLPKMACFVFEPIQGAGGVREFDPEAYDKIASACRESKTVIIADEVATGMGRAGYLARSQGLAIKPDILCLGKGLGNGEVAISVVLVSEQIEELIEKSTRHDALRYLWGETFGGSPSGCAAASVVLDYLTEPGFLQGVRERAGQVADLLRSELRGIPSVISVRAPEGAMMFAVRFNSADSATKVRQAMLAKGVRVVTEGNSVVLMPMLTMDLPLLRRIVGALSTAAHEICERN